MKTGWIENQMSMLTQLQEATALAGSSRWRRIPRLPYRIALPYWLQRNRSERGVQARCFFGRPMTVVLPEPVSTRIWRYGMFEHDVCFYLMSVLQAGDTFIDIGGHFGFFSMLGRELVGKQGRVVTFEPMPRTRAMLETNLAENAGPAEQHIIPAAAGDAPGEIIFKDFGLTGSAFATSKDVRTDEYACLGEVAVKLETIDRVSAELGLDRCALIKIDAENAELEVVKGALQTIKTLRPALIVETGDYGDASTNSRHVLDLIMAQDYLPFEFCEWNMRPHSIQGDYGYQNLLMVAAENVDRLKAHIATLR